MIAVGDFLRIWNRASSLAEAARILGLKSNSASCVACRLRADGYAVKRFRGGALTSVCADCPKRIRPPKVRCPRCAVAWLARQTPEAAP